MSAILTLTRTATILRGQSAILLASAGRRHASASQRWLGRHLHFGAGHARQRHEGARQVCFLLVFCDDNGGLYNAALRWGTRRRRLTPLSMRTQMEFSTTRQVVAHLALEAVQHLFLEMLDFWSGMSRDHPSILSMQSSSNQRACNNNNLCCLSSKFRFDRVMKQRRMIYEVLGRCMHLKTATTWPTLQKLGWATRFQTVWTRFRTCRWSLSRWTASRHSNSFALARRWQV